MHHPTRSGPPRRGVRAWLRAALVVAAALAAAPAGAQQGEISGVVVEAQSQRPVPGAQVTVQGQTRSAVTDPEGRFRITGVTGTQVTLQVDRLGYGRATRSATVGQTGLRVALAEAVLSLDALVVTGTPGSTEVRRLGNAVHTINAADVVERAPVNDVQQLLNGRAPGVVVMPGSGAVGSGSRIRVRGAGSISLRNEPLIYVDGVRINNAVATGPANQGFGSSSVSRINDINPEDIESIEIIRGPAAATLYGTEASNGVIQIITKKGLAGRPQWSVSLKEGVNYLQNPEGRFWTNYGIVGGQPVEIDIVELEAAEGRPIFRTGRLQEYDVSLAGGTERARYFLAGGLEQSEGAERSNELRRYNTRLNVNVSASDALDIGLSAGYVDGLTRLSAEAGFGGRVWSTVLATPLNLANRRGFHSGTPQQYDSLYQFSDDVNRLTASVQANHRPFGWLAQRLAFGVDYTRAQGDVFFPRIDAYATNPNVFAVFGEETLGRREVTSLNVRYRTVDYSATANFEPREGFTSSTSVGAQYYSNSTHSLFAQGAIFPSEGISSLSATSKDREFSESLVPEKNLGLFVQQQLGWQHRLFLTFGLRADDHSSFGRDFDRVYYPKVNGSWVVSEEPFFAAVPVLSTLKLRAAYGEAGQAPPVFSPLREYASGTGPGDTPGLVPFSLGNPELGPERGREVELGFDAGLLNDRLGVEFTWYRKRTTDAILQAPIAPSSGYAGLRAVNVGELRNWGTELLARGRVLSRGNVSWDVTASLATNGSEVVELGLGDNVDFIEAGGFIRHQEGFPIGSFFEQRVVSAQFDAAGNPIDVMCDNGDGGTMPCAGANGVFDGRDDAPNVFLGRSMPRLEAALSSDLRLFGNLRMYGLVDFKRGHKKLDGNLRVRCNFFGGRCRENFFPAEFPAERIAQVRSSNNLVDFLIQDASFAKLREVSLTYTLPAALAQRARAGRASVSLAGRNLHTWTNYEGLEPEAMFLGGTRGGNYGAWEQTTLPQLTQWVLSLNLDF